MPKQPKDLLCRKGCGKGFSFEVWRDKHEAKCVGAKHAETAKEPKPVRAKPASHRPRHETDHNGDGLVPLMRDEIQKLRLVAGRACRQADVLEKALQELVKE